jgi:hypothetical protein
LLKKKFASVSYGVEGTPGSFTPLGISAEVVLDNSGGVASGRPGSFTPVGMSVEVVLDNSGEVAEGTPGSFTPLGMSVEVVLDVSLLYVALAPEKPNIMDKIAPEKTNTKMTLMRDC